MLFFETLALLGTAAAAVAAPAAITVTAVAKAPKYADLRPNMPFNAHDVSNA